MMFQDACRCYSPLLCAVGCGNANCLGVFTGTGCIIRPGYVATALHNLCCNADEWPIVSTGRGLFRCEVVSRAESHDFVILKLAELLKADDRPSDPVAYPTLAKSVPGLGASVGFLTHWQEDGLNRHGLHFASGSISQIVRNADKVPRMLIANMRVCAGMSGSPVFDISANLQGLILESTAHGAIMLPIGTMQFPEEIPNA